AGPRRAPAALGTLVRALPARPAAAAARLPPPAARQLVVAIDLRLDATASRACCQRRRPDGRQLADADLHLDVARHRESTAGRRARTRGTPRSPPPDPRIAGTGRASHRSLRARRNTARWRRPRARRVPGW